MSEIRNFMLSVLQITAIYNAIDLGWRVHSIKKNKCIVLRKKKKDLSRIDRSTCKLIGALLNSQNSANYNNFC